MTKKKPTIHFVGADNHGWDPTNDLALWSSSRKFYLDDFLVFHYGHPEHDVVRVNESDYVEGRVDMRWIRYHSDQWNDYGSTAIRLDETGPWYFMCSKCLNLKLAVLVEPCPIEET